MIPNNLRRHRLAVPLRKQRLGIKCIHMARPAAHEKINDTLRLGRKMRRLRPGRHLAIQQRTQSHAAQTAGRLPEEGAARQFGLESFVHSRTSHSSRFIKTEANAVHASPWPRRR